MLQMSPLKTTIIKRVAKTGSAVMAWNVLFATRVLVVPQRRVRHCPRFFIAI